MSCFPGMKVATYFPSVSLQEGTAERDGVIYASLLGKLQVTTTSSKGGTEYVIKHPLQDERAVPCIGSTIIGRVTKISPRTVTVSILLTNSRKCEAGCVGIIRLQDISVETRPLVHAHLDNSSTSRRVYEAFRPGDVLRAQVLALAESSLYYLSTAVSEDLGVLVATSNAGKRMLPVSAHEMRCPQTGQLERRKVAQLQPCDK